MIWECLHSRRRSDALLCEIQARSSSLFPIYPFQFYVTEFVDTTVNYEMKITVADLRLTTKYVSWL